jgi:opacity protein-like surface antigen
MNWKCAIATTAMAMLLAPSVALADSIGDVENARAKERQGAYLSHQDREQLRRYGGNDDYGPVYGGYGYETYGYGGGYDDDDGVGYGPDYPTYSTDPY